MERTTGMRCTSASPHCTSLRPAKLLAMAPTSNKISNLSTTPEARHMNPQQFVGLPCARQDQQGLVEHAHDPVEHPGGNDTGHDHQQTRQQAFGQRSYARTQFEGAEEELLLALEVLALGAAFSAAAPVPAAAAASGLASVLASALASSVLAGALLPPRKSVTYQPEPLS